MFNRGAREGEVHLIHRGTIEWRCRSHEHTSSGANSEEGEIVHLTGVQEKGKFTSFTGAHQEGGAPHRGLRGVMCKFAPQIKGEEQEGGISKEGVRRGIVPCIHKNAPGGRGGEGGRVHLS